MSTALATLTSKLAARLDMGDGAGLMDTLKATAFKGASVTDDQMTALMIVANQYGLNPWTRELYAFPDKGGIVPVVGVDGWARIINNNPQFDGMDFEQDDEKCTCRIYRKDRSHPTSITEYFYECRRDNAQPWKTHPKRMMRHKAMIQCARIAFGFGGIYDQDEAERIVEGTVIDGNTGEVINKPPARPALEECSPEKFEQNKEAWRGLVVSGKKTADDLIAMLNTKAILTEDQMMTIDSWSHEGDA